MPLYKRPIPYKTKFKAVKQYLESKKTLRTVAIEMSIPFTTLRYWVQLYEEGGERRLRTRGVHKRKITKQTEQRVMLLKEQKPSLTIDSAHDILIKRGIVISRKAIWHIWSEYCLIGQTDQNPVFTLRHPTPTIQAALDEVKVLYKKGNVRKAAKIFNDLPNVPDDDIMFKIPERLLSPRRKLDRLGNEFGLISLREYARKARRIGMLLEKNKFLYSSIIANFLELAALTSMGKPDEVYALLTKLSGKMKGIKTNTFKFMFNLYMISYYSYTMQTAKALECLNACRKLVYQSNSLFFLGTLAVLMTYVGKYREAARYFKKSLEKETRDIDAARTALSIALCGDGIAGDYVACRKRLRQAQRLLKMHAWVSADYYAAQAFIAYGEGKLQTAAEHFLKPLQLSSREAFYHRIYLTSVGLASVAMALNKRTDARLRLRKYLPLIRKHRLVKEQIIMNVLLGIDVTVTREMRRMPDLRLLHLMRVANQTKRIGDYRKAHRYATSQKLLGLFQRWIVFFPDIVLYMLERGKRTNLPKVILEFPIFNEKRTVFHTKLLGPLVVSRNRRLLRTKLSPQESAVWIHLALRAGQPGGYIPLSDVYSNFWSRGKQPAGRLSHILMAIKNSIRMPAHFISIVSRQSQPRLVNRGMYLTTDYQEIEMLLTQTKVLKKANEWQFARRDYLRAFNLVRGEPFRKMYDPWSEQVRRVILSEICRAAEDFVQGSREHGSTKEAKKVLERLAAALPHSAEIKKLQSDL